MLQLWQDPSQAHKSHETFQYIHSALNFYRCALELCLACSHTPEHNLIKQQAKEFNSEFACISEFKIRPKRYINLILISFM